MSAGVDKTNALLDEERRLASHQEVKASIDKAVNTRIKQESARVEPTEAGEVAEVAHDLKQQSVHEAVSTEREFGARQNCSPDFTDRRLLLQSHLRPDRSRVPARAGGRAGRQWIRSVYRRGYSTAACALRTNSGNSVGRSVPGPDVLPVRARCLHSDSSRNQWCVSFSRAPQGNSVRLMRWA
jgi:hypothetical protein